MVPLLKEITTTILEKNENIYTLTLNSNVLRFLESCFQYLSFLLTRIIINRRPYSMLSLSTLGTWTKPGRYCSEGKRRRGEVRRDAVRG